jgi:TonB family protein
LLSFNTVHPDLFLGNRLNNSIIKKRIIMMYKKRSTRKQQWKYLIAVPVFTLLMFFISCENNAPVQNNSSDLENEEITEVRTDTPDDVFKVVEQMPRFPGCEDLEGSEEEIQACSNKQLMTYLFKNLKYPESARQKGTEGTVIAQFVVNKAGMVEDANIVRDIGDGCGEAVLDVISSMNTMDTQWMPGRQRGETVKVMYTLPVKFKLEDGKEEK